MTTTPLLITIDGSQYAAELQDNPCATALKNELPVTLTFQDFGGQEVLADAPKKLPMSGMPASAGASPGDIGYYSPTGSIVFYYATVSPFPGIAHLGKFTEDVGFLASTRENLEVTISLAE